MFLLVQACHLGGVPSRVSGAVTQPAESSETISTRSRVDPTELSRSLDEIMGQHEYTWRMPRTKSAVDQESGVAAFVNASVNALKKIARPIVRIVRDVYRWLLNKFKPKEDELTKSGWLGSLDWTGGLPYFVGVILAMAGALLAYVSWRRRRSQHSVELAAQPVVPVPDLASEQLLADQLPEEQWADLAREMAARGELRLALRAWYLASLSNLAQREMIRLTRYKSNRDYDRELRRRVRSRADLIAAFGDNLNVLERVWYGMHEVTDAAVATFVHNVERIRAG